MCVGVSVECRRNCEGYGQHNIAWISSIFCLLTASMRTYMYIRIFV